MDRGETRESIDGYSEKRHSKPPAKIKSVANELQVVPKAQKETVKEADEAIEKRVKEALKSHEAAEDVNVEMKNGVARLTGEAPSRTEAMRVAVVVRAVPGVRAVNNELRVGHEMASGETGRKY